MFHLCAATAQTHIQQTSFDSIWGIALNDFFSTHSLRKKGKKWEFLFISNANSHIKWWAQRFTFLYVEFLLEKKYFHVSLSKVLDSYSICAAASSTTASVLNGAVLGRLWIWNSVALSKDLDDYCFIRTSFARLGQTNSHSYLHKS